MPADQKLRVEIETQFAANPSLRGQVIAVDVRDGVATLFGFVDSLIQKWLAEEIASHINGIIGVVHDIEVRLPGVDRRPDPHIAEQVVTAFDHDIPEVADRITVTVQNGHVTLEGEVPDKANRDRAAELAGSARGVVGVSNDIRITPSALADVLRQKIEEALQRLADADSRNISIDVDEGRVLLQGAVRSWAEREEAEQAVNTTPGVTTVENHIVIAVHRQELNHDR
jgi:osmotically-inducible protein OsmY